jgi:hypothetical protein
MSLEYLAAGQVLSELHIGLIISTGIAGEKIAQASSATVYSIATQAYAEKTTGSNWQGSIASAYSGTSSKGVESTKQATTIQSDLVSSTSKEVSTTKAITTISLLSSEQAEKIVETAKPSVTMALATHSWDWEVFDNLTGGFAASIILSAQTPTSEKEARSDKTGSPIGFELVTTPSKESVSFMLDSGLVVSSVSVAEKEATSGFTTQLVVGEVVATWTKEAHGAAHATYYSLWDFRGTARTIAPTIITYRCDISNVRKPVFDPSKSYIDITVTDITYHTIPRR